MQGSINCMNFGMFQRGQQIKYYVNVKKKRIRDKVKSERRGVRGPP